MINIKSRFKVLGIIVLVVIIIVVAVVYILQRKKSITNVPVTIVSSIPEQGASGVSVFNSITITFSQKVDPSTITIMSDPSESWNISQTTPTAISLSHQLYLKVATTYKLTVLQSGKTIGTIVFETAHEQNDPRQLQVIQQEMNKDYPLASLTPYETSNFRVVYTAPLTLGIYLKNSTLAEDAILEVRSWVELNGVNPTTHKYIILAATPNPKP